MARVKQNPTKLSAKTKTVTNEDGTVSVIEKKSRRRKPGTVALRDIAHLQKGGQLLIQRRPFDRLVREIIQESPMGADKRLQGAALAAIQEAAESYMVDHFRAMQKVANHAERITVTPKDSRLVLDIRDVAKVKAMVA